MTEFAQYLTYTALDLYQCASCWQILVSVDGKCGS